MMRLLRDTRGVSAIEFAFALPFLLLLYLGGYQVSDAISAYRKVTVTTRTVADLATQYTEVKDQDLDQILAASQQVMAPYQLANAAITVTQVSVDNSGNAKVSWSRGLNATALAQDSAYTLPSQVKQNNTSLIVATVNYNYVPLVSKMMGTLPMRDTIMMSPRASASVKKVS